MKGILARKKMLVKTLLVSPTSATHMDNISKEIFWDLAFNYQHE